MLILTVIAGPNGSGKSTLTDLLVRQATELGEYLNADDIARDLEGLPSEVSAMAQQMVRQRRDAALVEHRSHAFETVMSHPSHIEYMAKAERQGFYIRLFFVATDDPVINLDRVANRVAHGGHDVPRARIASRYERCLDNLPAAMAVAHEVEIFDNSSADRPMRPLAQILRRAGLALLVHRDIARQARKKVDPDDIPVWWLEVLLQVKPDDPFADGFLP